MTSRSSAGIVFHALAGAAATMSVGVGSFFAGAAPQQTRRRRRATMGAHRFLLPRGGGPAEHSRRRYRRRAMYTATLMLLGSGELGREFTIAAKRLGCRIIACDRYANAPAMQMADACEVFPMLDGKALRAAVEKHKPDVIVPEIEAIDTATLAELEKEGWRVAPSAKAVQLTMNRDGIRDFAAQRARPRHLEIPLRRKPRGRHRRRRRSRPPVRDQAGDVEFGQGPEHGEDGRGGRRRLGLCGRKDARRPAAGHRRGIRRVRQRDHAAHRRDQGRDLFCPPVGHRQELGDYRESWQPAAHPAGRAPIRAVSRRARSSRRSAATAVRSRVLRSRRPGDLLGAVARARTTPAW